MIYSNQYNYMIINIDDIIHIYYYILIIPCNPPKDRTTSITNRGFPSREAWEATPSPGWANLTQACTSCEAIGGFAHIFLNKS
jgi:hypothetical protein